VGFGEGVGYALEGETDADFQRIGAGLGEQAVVKPAAAAEAVVVIVEGEAGTDKGVDFAQRDFRGTGGGFENAEGAGNQVVTGMKTEVVADDFREQPGEPGVVGQNSREIDLAGQRRIDGDGAEGGAVEQPLVQGGAGGLGIAGVLAESLPHRLAEQGFCGDGFGNCHLPRRRLFPSLRPMMRFWQVAVMVCVTLAVLRADEAGRAFMWDPPRVVASAFSPDLGMLDSERDEYATNLATHAGNSLAAAKASVSALAAARRTLGLALQLSPRNKRAVVVNFQLSKGLLPEAVESNYSPPVLARLLLTRGQLLAKQGGEENKRLARYFIQLAAEMDPKNEDAVYASEVQRLDHGPLDWSLVTDSEEKKP